ncbi:MAG: tRNA (guanosine(37)-N1)-methyltransferase TrmD [Gammaproteobacteria bacterium]|nr:tRNA (guanosine(37)-N1)-methyltransferase TrmD [Gammaproteobacteria bacterium]
MSHFTLITLFPQVVDLVADFGVTGRAVARGLIRLDAVNPRDFAVNKHGTVDDSPYGGGPGMVMMVPPLRAAITRAKEFTPGVRSHVVYMSPQGRPLTQQRVVELGNYPHLVLIAGRYEGVDERLLERDVDEEISVGDYVLSGGELAACVVVDAVARTLPDVLGDQDSALQDSFSHGVLDYPHYTRPESIDGQTVPSILLSGDHGAIARWRRKQALGRTWQRRPDLLAAVPLSPQDLELLEEFKAEQGAFPT